MTGYGQARLCEEAGRGTVLKTTERDSGLITNMQKEIDRLFTI